LNDKLRSIQHIHVALDGGERVARFQSRADDDIPQQQCPHEFFGHEVTDEAGEEVGEVQGINQ
jgi:hypothetical protein